MILGTVPLRCKPRDIPAPSLVLSPIAAKASPPARGASVVGVALIWIARHWLQTYAAGRERRSPLVVLSNCDWARIVLVIVATVVVVGCRTSFVLHKLPISSLLRKRALTRRHLRLGSSSKCGGVCVAEDYTRCRANDPCLNRARADGLSACCSVPGAGPSTANHVNPGD